MPTSHIRVLIADDQPIVRDGIDTWLRTLEQVAVVATARSFDEAIAAAEQYAADLLILDLGGMQGSPLAFLHHLQRIRPQLRVIIFSSTIDLAPELIAAGALGYVAKDELSSALTEAVITVVRGQAYLSPRVEEYLAQPTAPVPLRPKELVALKLLSQGLTTFEIAEQMGIDPRSVQNYITAMRRKTGCSQRTQLTDWYRRMYGAGG